MKMKFNILAVLVLITISIANLRVVRKNEKKSKNREWLEKKGPGNKCPDSCQPNTKDDIGYYKECSFFVKFTNQYFYRYCRFTKCVEAGDQRANCNMCYFESASGYQHEDRPINWGSLAGSNTGCYKMKTAIDPCAESSARAKHLSCKCFKSTSDIYNTDKCRCYRESHKSPEEGGEPRDLTELSSKCKCWYNANYQTNIYVDPDECGDCLSVLDFTPEDKKDKCCKYANKARANKVCYCKDF